MQRKFAYNLLPFLVFLFLLWGCKKNDANSTKSEESRELSLFSVVGAKNWFTSISQNASASKNNSTNGTFSNPLPDWSKAINTEDQEFYAIEVPIRFDKSAGFNTHSVNGDEEKPMNTKTSLVILKHKQTGALRSVLMLLTASQGVNLQNVNYGSRTEFSGTILFTTMEGELINGWIYENGKVKSTINKKEQNVANREELPGDCTTIQIDWYEQTCTYYSNNTEVCSGWAYTHTTYQTVCTDDGSSGGGGVGGTSGCSYTTTAAQNFLNAVTYSVTTNGSVVSGPTSAPDASGIVEKELFIDKHRVNFNIMAGFTVTYAVLFKGKVDKAGTSQPWKWKTFNFDKAQQVSGSCPPCFAESTTATFATSISSDKKNANFSGIVSSTITVSCLFGYRASTKTVPLNDSYVADELAR